MNIQQQTEKMALAIILVITKGQHINKKRPDRSLYLMFSVRAGGSLFASRLSIACSNTFLEYLRQLTKYRLC